VKRERNVVCARTEGSKGNPWRASLALLAAQQEVPMKEQTAQRAPQARSMSVRLRKKQKNLAPTCAAGTVRASGYAIVKKLSLN